MQGGWGRARGEKARARMLARGLGGTRLGPVASKGHMARNDGAVVYEDVGASCGGIGVGPNGPRGEQASAACQ